MLRYKYVHYILFLFTRKEFCLNCAIPSQINQINKWIPPTPALAVCEAQVHAVAGQEGAAVQGELHAGRVGDGLTQQGHRFACRGRRGPTAAAAEGVQRTHVTCAVQDLRGERESLSNLKFHRNL